MEFDQLRHLLRVADLASVALPAREYDINHRQDILKAILIGK